MTMQQHTFEAPRGLRFMTRSAVRREAIKQKRAASRDLQKERDAVLVRLYERHAAALYHALRADAVNRLLARDGRPTDDKAAQKAWRAFHAVGADFARLPAAGPIGELKVKVTGLRSAEWISLTAEEELDLGILRPAKPDTSDADDDDGVPY